MRYLAKITCAGLLLSGIPAFAFAAGADTEQGQTPAAPSNAGADTQPNKGSNACDDQRRKSHEQRRQGGGEEGR